MDFDLCGFVVWIVEQFVLLGALEGLYSLNSTQMESTMEQVGLSVCLSGSPHVF